MHKILPIFILLLLITASIAFFYLPAKQFIAYNFNLTPDAKAPCCRVAEVVNSSGNFDENVSIAVFNNQIIDYPKTSLAEANQDFGYGNSNVLGTTNANGEEKWIDVSLSEQKVRAYEGNKVVMEFLISSGLWDSTNRGTFNIWYKTRNQRMKGGSKELGTYYDLPNVPNNMFYDGGRALHGAYWHNNFGHPMSHGCVNEPLASAAQIFEWAGPIVPPGQNVVRATPENPGTRVVVH